ncbi:MAG TPA: DUF4124 domain-containing protein [Steroidobacteraceae bacterium]|nr:DUF4124 domain-containing protein [Steroidobacteraceae bacterium]
MQARQSLLAIGLLAAFTVQAAVIYKWVDADGVVHYSDQASPGAEKIVTGGSLNSMAAGRGATGPSSPAPQQRAQGGLNYTEFAITSPAPEQTIFGDDVIPVRLNLDPALRPNQAITWHLNGQQLDSPPSALSFALPRLDRGTYALTATITDQQTSESQTSSSVTFFVRQPSALSPQSPLHK